MLTVRRFFLLFLLFILISALPALTADLFRDDFSKFPTGWLTQPIGQINAAIQEYHYLPYRVCWGRGRTRSSHGCVADQRGGWQGVSRTGS
jgi:hypothetical protein